MKKILFSLLSLILLAASFVTSAVAAQTSADRAQNWYVMRAGRLRPSSGEAALLAKYGGYYLDAKKTDEDSDRVIYLTFDAGYENGNVAKILDVLKREGVPGTFFILEHLVKANPELCRRMVTEGHTVCNHTRKHQDMTKRTDEEMKDDLCGLEEIFLQEIGVPMAKYFRFPEGRYSERALACAQSLGYRSIFWSFGYADWDNQKQPDPEKSKKLILSNTHNGEVILLHPTSATNAAILGDLIQTWRTMGYRFGTMEELTAMKP